LIVGILIVRFVRAARFRARLIVLSKPYPLQQIKVAQASLLEATLLAPQSTDSSPFYWNRGRVRGALAGRRFVWLTRWPGERRKDFGF